MTKYIWRVPSLVAKLPCPMCGEEIEFSVNFTKLFQRKPLDSSEKVGNICMNCFLPHKDCLCEHTTGVNKTGVIGREENAH